MAVKTYDKQCLALAKSFLSDTQAAHFPERQKFSLEDALAKDIQETIENFLEEQKLNT